MAHKNEQTKEELDWEKDLEERIAVVEQEQSAKRMTRRDYVVVGVLCAFCMIVIILGAYI